MEPELGASAPPLIEPAQLAGWVIHQSDDVIVVNKPGWVVCHPSKRGPWSSLVGALREHLQIPTLHPVNRLDRETSGVVVVALNEIAARRYQMAMQNRRVEKIYLALLEGELQNEIAVDLPLIRDEQSNVAVKRRAAALGEPGGESAQTHFTPLICKNGYTLARIIPHTGRTHQIRVHAQSIGYAIVGDKLYGPDSTLYLEFAKHGWTSHHAELLPIQRQALHAARLHFLDEGLGDFTAPPPEDMMEFASCKMDLDLAAVWATSASEIASDQ